MDGSYFAYALLLGALGWFIGDYQRQARYRRDARANLAQSKQRSDERAQQRAAALRNVFSDSRGDLHSIPDDDDDDRSPESGAGRRAVPRADYRARAGRHAPGRGTDLQYAAPVILSRYVP